MTPPEIRTAAVEEEVGRQAGFVRALARRLVADPHRADDVAQQACLQALRAQPDPKGGLRGWLSTVTRRAVSRMRREDARRERRESASARPDRVAPVNEVIDRERSIRRLMDAVFTLPEPYRSTIVLRFYEDLAPSDIAERLGVPAATVRTRLHRGLAMLRERLDADTGARGEWRLGLLPFALGPSWRVVAESIAGATATTVTSATAESAAGLGVLLMTKKIIAACLVVALAGVTWFIVDDGEPQDDVLPTPNRTARTVADGDAESDADRDRVGPSMTSPIGTARFRESPRGGTGAPKAAGAARATLVGRVVDEAGDPVADADVRLKLSRSGRDAHGLSTSHEEIADLDVRTDSNGRFTFTHVPVGYEARLRARRNDLCDANRDVGVEEAVTIDVGEMVAKAGGSLAGRVTGPEDVSVRSATITAWKAPDVAARPGMMVVSRPDLGTGRTARVRADGTYRIDGLESGEWIVGADLAGFPRTMRQPSRVARGAVTWDVDLEIRDGARLVGQVLDSEGRVVEGATIDYRQDDGTLAALADQRATATTKTGADGRFVIRGLADVAGLLRVSKHGMRSASMSELAPGGEELVIRLDPAAIIHGVVTTPAGASPETFDVIPATRGRFGIRSRGRMQVVYGEEAAAAAGVTSSPGLFAVTQVPDSDVVLRIRSSGFSDEIIGPFRVPAGGSHDASVQLSPEKIVTGVVLDPAGRPVAGAEVRASEPSRTGEPGSDLSRRVERRIVRRSAPGGVPEPEIPRAGDGPTALTGPDGRFELRGLALRPWHLVATHRNHAQSDATSVDLIGDGPFDVEITLRESGGVQGIVYGKDGAPKAGARVAISEVGQDGGVPSVPINVLTGNDGRFERHGLVPGSYTARLADRPEEGRVMVMRIGETRPDPSTVPFVVEPGATASVTIKEPEYGAITGVVRANGSPVAEARLGLKPEGAPDLMSPTVISTDAAGAFAFEDVMPGSYVLTVNGPGSARPVHRKVTVRAKTPSNEIIELPSGGIEGRVLDQDGEPVAGMTISVIPTAEDKADRPRTRGIMVMMTDDGSGPATTVRMIGDDTSVEPVKTDEDGRFLVRFLAADTYNVRVSGGGWIPARQENVDVKDDLVTRHVDMQTSKGGTIVATATASDGTPPAIIGRVRKAGQEEDEPLDTQAAPGGQALRFTGLAPGSYVVSMEVPGPATDGKLEGKTTVTVEPGVETPAEVRLGRAR